MRNGWKSGSRELCRPVRYSEKLRFQSPNDLDAGAINIGHWWVDHISRALRRLESWLESPIAMKTDSVCTGLYRGRDINSTGTRLCWNSVIGTICMGLCGKRVITSIRAGLFAKRGFDSIHTGLCRGRAICSIRRGLCPAGAGRKSLRALT
jgi:hypothetical protein